MNGRAYQQGKTPIFFEMKFPPFEIRD